MPSSPIVFFILFYISSHLPYRYHVALCDSTLYSFTVSSPATSGNTRMFNFPLLYVVSRIGRVHELATEQTN